MCCNVYLTLQYVAMQFRNAQFDICFICLTYHFSYNHGLPRFVCVLKGLFKGTTDVDSQKKKKNEKKKMAV